MSSSSSPILLIELPAELWPKQPPTPNTAEPIAAIPLRSFDPAERKIRTRKGKNEVLPDGYTTWREYRKDGKNYDTYYSDPDEQYKFRSWPEMMAYKDHGIIPKRPGPKSKRKRGARTTSVSAASQKPMKRKPDAPGEDGKAKSEAAAA